VFAPSAVEFDPSGLEIPSIFTPTTIFRTHTLPLSNTATMAPSNLPPLFNATAQDIEMLLSAQCHIGSKNLQVHMEPYLWKTRPDGVNVLNIGKTWYVHVLTVIYIIY
jgi:small subunit ribosomal protein SAe